MIVINRDGLALGWGVVALFLAVDVVALIVWAVQHRRTERDRDNAAFDRHSDLMIVLEQIRDSLGDSYTTHEEINKAVTMIRDDLQMERENRS
jgi:hypothetical protein